MSFTALDITYKTLGLVKDDPSLANDITPLKLQKLLFYMQGWYAGNYHTRLFTDDIYAWEYGPVVVSVYHKFKQYGSVDLLKQDEVTIPEDLPSFTLKDGNKKSHDVASDLKDVLNVYGNMSAYELVTRTHKEQVWFKNFNSSNKVIPFDEIRKAFESKLVGAAE